MEKPTFALREIFPEREGETLPEIVRASKLGSPPVSRSGMWLLSTPEMPVESLKLVPLVKEGK